MDFAKLAALFLRRAAFLPPFLHLSQTVGCRIPNLNFFHLDVVWCWEALQQPPEVLVEEDYDMVLDFLAERYGVGRVNCQLARRRA